jgi:hypothetical protein
MGVNFTMQGRLCVAVYSALGGTLNRPCASPVPAAVHYPRRIIVQFEEKIKVLSNLPALLSLCLPISQDLH